MAQEGFVPFRGYRTWYRIAGDREEAGKLPLVLLHGGPGVPHDYLEPLEEMVATGRRVVFYDQLGCGNSDQPHDPSLWTVPLFVDELAAVREALGLDRIHLLGHSWGGMLALEYALMRPMGLASLVLAGSPINMRQWITEVNRLRAALPADIQETLTKHEKAGTTDNPEYVNAVLVFYGRHLCRSDPWPDCVNRSFEKLMKNPEVYATMYGPSEFYVTGNMKDWDITPRLHEIHIPTLVTSGRYDEATPAIMETLHRAIAGSEWVRFEESSHLAHVEETEQYLQVLTGFLDRVESDR